MYKCKIVFLSLFFLSSLQAQASCLALLMLGLEKMGVTFSMDTIQQLRPDTKEELEQLGHVRKLAVEAIENKTGPGEDFFEKLLVEYVNQGNKVEVLHTKYLNDPPKDLAAWLEYRIEIATFGGYGEKIRELLNEKTMSDRFVLVRAEYMLSHFKELEQLDALLRSYPKTKD